MKLSVVVVTLNSGKALTDTIDSILKQTSKDYEIVIKDGGSKDGSVEALSERHLECINIYRESDTGIYDAMNQAVSHAKGDFVLFMNAGDSFYSDDVIEKFVAKNLKPFRLIAYGDTYFELSKSLSKAPAKITGSVCYRNIPCHQAIIYSKDMLLERGFDTSLKIRADYEHFIHSFYKTDCEFVYLNFPICSYEGGGFSEKNQKLDKEEYKISVKRHIPFMERFRYRAFLILTLYRLRGVLARNEKTAALYQWIKGKIQ